MYNHNYSRFLTFVRILVDETNKDVTLTLKDVLKRMEDYGYQLERKSFFRYIKYMKEAGIVIEHVGNPPYHYYYKDGWI